MIATAKLFHYYKSLANKSIERLNDEQLFFSHHAESNSVAVIMKHLAGNMISRWTDFLQSDGEKPWRDRDREFSTSNESRAELLVYWEKGWSCLFDALASLTDSDRHRIVYIRNEGHTVDEAIQRQIAHYAYHVGQIVFIAKMLSETWSSLSIPRNQSLTYNQKKFIQDRSNRHFTEGI